MKSAGYLVSSTAELSAGMQYGKYDFHCRKSGFMIDSYRNPTSIVNDGNRIIRIDENLNVITISCKRLIY